MIVLAIDTVANLCAACVCDSEGRRELGRAVRDIGKGHAEVLMDVIDEALVASGVSMKQIGAVAVATGPGSFTGIRVGVSVARGLALALGVPSAGVGTLEALAFEARETAGPARVLAAIDGGRDGIYAAVYDEFGKLSYAPAVLDLEKIAKLAGDAGMLVGSAARRIATELGSGVRLGSERPTADIGVYARLVIAHGFSSEKPRPLYLRAPDAKPQSHFALPRKAP